MGRKKTTVREDENPAASQGGDKSKKKGRVIDDDEYSIGTELSEDQQNLGFEKQNNEDEVAPVSGKKKGKKGNSKAAQSKGEDQEEEEEDDAPEVVFSGKKKPKSKKSGNSLFSTSSFDVLEEDKDDESHPILGKEADEYKENDDGEEEEDPVVTFSGKKKSSKSSKKSNSLFTASAFDAIPDDGDEVDTTVSENEYKIENDDAPVIAFSGKKKSSKSSKKSSSLFTASTFDGLDEGGDTNDENKEEDEEPPVIMFSGKKKSSKSSKKSSSLFSAALLDEENEDDASVSEQKSTTGSADDTVDGSGLQNEDDASMAFFSGKKKPSKSKKINSIIPASSFDIGLGDEVTEPEQPSLRSMSIEDDGNNGNDAKVNKQVSEDVAGTSKAKKKKKKGGRTAQEEDDLDKILAELGEGPPLLKPTGPAPQEEKVQVQLESVGSVDATGEKEADAEAGESAASKKKKKKKEKEKEKKAAAAVATAVEVKEEKQEETKNKVSDKKIPKHVREMQEALTRRKEAEERKKREEEERLRKEEEERLRLEEIERQAEEARRKKKEREKEKLLKKKQEGKLLTGKQKEEARRLEAMRNQILANAGGLPLPTADPGGVTAKRPKYQTKKAKMPPLQANGGDLQAVENIEAKQSQQETVAEVESLEVERAEEVDSTNVEEPFEVDHGIEENRTEEDDDEDEWDAKSWDDAVVTLPVKSAFDEEEDGSEPEPVVKKETKRAMPLTSRDAGAPSSLSTVAAKNLISPPPMKMQDIESKEDHHEVEFTDKSRKREAAMKKEARTADALSKRSAEDLRSPICCIMGHVDTGKTKLLDCIRGTNVQEGEAGGITQQIGATYFPAENIRERTKELKADAKLKVPGLLVIDTPGHESFTNLRSRGSGLCDIAILVVDIMHGLEPQTIESLNLLKMRNTEFIVALNKVDRLYGWKSCPNAPIVKAMKQQSKDVQNEFNMRLTQIITQFMEQGLNTELYYKNKEMGETFSIVPTSAISGEGIPDLLLLLVQWTQKTMVEKLMFSNEMQCTVLEVKVVEGHGTTIDVVLVNGVLHEGDQIVVCGMQEPIVTTIRALLTPHPMKELRVKVRFLLTKSSLDVTGGSFRMELRVENVWHSLQGTYLHHKEIKAAQGIKISAQGLEHALAGTGLHVVGPDDDLEDIKEAAMQDMKSVMSRIDKSGEGVCVQASTLGSLEALLEFLKSPAVNIPVSGISIGPVHKRDVMRASVMLERKKEYATILAFDVKVTPEARELADDTGVKIFIADIIYHLFDQFKAYIDNLKEEKKKEAAEEAVFPCVLQIMPNCVFNKKDPIVLGVDVIEGIAKVSFSGLIHCILVFLQIASTNAEEQQKMYGRHFEIDDELVSHITRKSIDILKVNYREDLSIEEWRLVVKLKTLFKIQ
ncbi:hypothetical protein HHK36_002613 [Tetracentron sinense]|uniref:Tr-type G domain-containing protein n=1 Tax=Tetracentron sinense TaxID=13715 RepID=A0A834ZVX6_TETSI|nr:hypothetical protein HHK36_002613 [Tetracentron sinense]